METKQHDAGEFRDWAALQGPPLLRFAYLITQSTHEAEDVTQEALLATYRKWARVRQMARPASYARRCVVNAARDRWRRHGSRETPTESGGWQDGAPLLDHAARITEADAAWQMCLTLPPRQRAVLVLTYYEDCSVQQVADILRCRPSTVRSQLSRALAALRAAAPQLTQEVSS